MTKEPQYLPAEAFKVGSRIKLRHTSSRNHNENMIGKITNIILNTVNGSLIFHVAFDNCTCGGYKAAKWCDGFKYERWDSIGSYWLELLPPETRWSRISK